MSGPEQHSVLRRGLHVTLVVAGFFMVWQLAVMVAKPPEYLLPAPLAIFEEIRSAPLWFLDHALRTVGATLLGFSAALTVGCLAAVGIVYSRFLEATIYTTLVAINSMPKVALAPLFVVWMGTGHSSKIAMAFLIAIFAIVIDAVLGLRSLDNEIIDLSRSMRASPLKLLWKIRLPNALPSLFAGMKVAIGLSLVGVLVGEFVSAQRGLGYLILAAQGAFDTPRVFVSILLLSVMGTLFFRLIEFIERRAIPWHVSQRGSTH